MRNVGINGFGRIGRMVLRAWVDYVYQCKVLRMEPKILIKAVNNPLKKGQTKEHFLHLLEYDSVHGKMNKEIEVTTKGFKIFGYEIAFFSEMDPSLINWSSENIEVVVDSTGIFKDKAGLGKHMRGTVKKVIMSAPGDGLDKTVVMGVNDHEYDSNIHHILSNASCTTNCLAPVAKIIDKAFGIEKGLVSTCHAVTADQRLVDGEHEDMRRARAAFASMILTKTGAAKAVGEVLPHLNGKLDGMSIRVPTLDVSVIDANFVLKKTTTAEEVNQLFREASKGEYMGIVSVSDKELVSVDFTGNSNSAIVDSKYTKVMDGNLLKVMAWYDNEWGYSCRVLDLIKIL